MIELKIGAAAETGMGWLEFLSSLVGSLAWPAAAVFIAIIFRGQIKGLLGKLRKLSWGDKTADFSDKLDEAENVARQVEDVPGPVENPDDAAELRPEEIITERFTRLLEIAPSAAILEAWKEIEELLYLIANNNKIKSNEIFKHHGNKILGRRATPRTSLAALSNMGVLPSELFNMLKELQQLRNLAAHATVSVTDALRFQTLATDAKRQLEHLLRSTTRGA